ncbi:hypothetical protein ONE63_000097 [Megalurothrips usitatus]|uniref:Uncharacterized protein n=1 Tax=Megalurothrips usitatus TaxID=439358 RepID=A0AAV7XXE8_9NEOP|nr:hypothetical protein ONE63_000097 [Megalurothrips usitatus]
MFNLKIALLASALLALAHEADSKAIGGLPDDVDGLAPADAALSRVRRQLAETISGTIKDILSPAERREKCCKDNGKFLFKDCDKESCDRWENGAPADAFSNTFRMGLGGIPAPSFGAPNGAGGFGLYTPEP